MAISVVQEHSAQTSGVLTAVVTISAVGSGNILIVGANIVGANAATGITITDGSSDAFTDSGLGTVITGNVASYSLMGAFFTATAGVTTVTATALTGAPSFLEIIAWEISGIPQATAAFDKKLFNTSATGTAMTSGSTGTLTSATEIGIGYLIANQGSAQTSGKGAAWVYDEASTGISAAGNGAQHIITASTAALTATQDESQTGWDVWCVTAYDTAGAGDTLGGAMQRFMM